LKISAARSEHCNRIKILDAGDGVSGRKIHRFIQNALTASSPEGQDLATRLKTQDWHILRRVLALRKDRQKAFDEIIRRVTKDGEGFSRALYFEAVERHEASLKAAAHEQMRQESSDPLPAPVSQAAKDEEATPGVKESVHHSAAPLPGSPAASPPTPSRSRAKDQAEDPEERLYRTRAASYTAMVEHEDGPAVLLLREKYQRRLEAPARAELVEFISIETTTRLMLLPRW